MGNKLQKLRDTVASVQNHVNLAVQTDSRVEGLQCSSGTSAEQIQKPEGGDATDLNSEGVQRSGESADAPKSVATSSSPAAEFLHSEATVDGKESTASGNSVEVRQSFQARNTSTVSGRDKDFGSEPSCNLGGGRDIKKDTSSDLESSDVHSGDVNVRDSGCKFVAVSSCAIVTVLKFTEKCRP